uniref:NADH-ubiquinone oxidoreductase chain 6 n=1 Tax=Cycloneda sanguinea TaxID=633097 RepID=A0A173GHI4_9CUCU|nr:NADH dehydrogenase subunit 6 [Cycloneda sanguinea]
MSILMITTILMIFLKHPLTLGINILMHTILMSMMMGLKSMNFWFSYILMLIMIGGLLILFIYMTSIASNEKFKFNFKITLMLILIFLMFNFMSKSMIMEMNNEMINNLYFNMFFNKFLNFPNSNIFIIIIFYLLITMMAIVKMTKINFGPLRQMK